MRTNWIVLLSMSLSFTACGVAQVGALEGEGDGTADELVEYSPQGEFEDEPTVEGMSALESIPDGEEEAVEEGAIDEEDSTVDSEEVVEVDPSVFEEDAAAGEPDDGETGESAQELVSCGARRLVTGYMRGKKWRFIRVWADTKPITRSGGNAYYYMRRAAQRDGVRLRVISGFRTMAQQKYLYNCYRTGRCNNGNLAARPGYSNHQVGRAFDLNTRDSGVYRWLQKNARRYGFVRTVPSERWHWEYRARIRTVPCP